MKREHTRVQITHHCVSRFHERFRPALDTIGARRELEMLVGIGEIDAHPPAWMAAREREAAVAYLIVGEDLVVPLAFGHGDYDWVAKTCIPRGGISQKARRRRNERGRARRAARRAKRSRR